MLQQEKPVRTMRRTVGMLVRYFQNGLFDNIEDPRSKRGRRWHSALPLMKAACLGLASGCRGLSEVEGLTSNLTAAARKKLGIIRGVPDTTLRNFLCRLKMEDLCQLIARVGYDAFRRKAVHMYSWLPWGVFSLDGKYPTIRDIREDTKDNQYTQVHHDRETKAATHGVVRVITSVLISAVGRPILMATPVPKETNEVGHFRKAFADLLRTYRSQFRVVMYDAGGASQENADAVVQAKKDYIFQIADPNWLIYQMAEMLLAKVKPQFVTEDVKGDKKLVREISLITSQPTAKNICVWSHVRTIIRVTNRVIQNGNCISDDARYFVTSLAKEELTYENWLRLIVLRWGVETVHQILDVSFGEDDHPWITANGNGALAVMLLRRMVYTILTFYRSVTQRSDENREQTWKNLFAQIARALLSASDSTFEAIRTRHYATPPAFS